MEMVYVSMSNLEYTITMYLHYREKYRGMLTSKQIKKLDDEYFGWITDTSNRWGDDCLYDKIRSQYFKVTSIEFDTVHLGEFSVGYINEFGGNSSNIRLRYRGKSDHSGIFDVERGNGNAG